MVLATASIQQKETAKFRWRAYYAENSEKMRRRVQEARERDREQDRERSRSYYVKNSEKLRERRRERYHASKHLNKNVHVQVTNNGGAIRGVLQTPEACGGKA